MGSQKSDRSNKFVTEKIGPNSSFNMDKIDKLSIEPPEEGMADKKGEDGSNNEFREPMPMSQRFKQAQQVKDGANQQDVSITSEDKTHLAKIPINIPPEQKN